MTGRTPYLRIDRDASARRIACDIEVLSGPSFTMSPTAICRYAYTPAYRNTLAFLRREFTALGFEVYEDPVGNFVARNRPAGQRVFGLGSHCDSNRNGGRYDGTLGVVTALEVCRLSRELGLDLPIQVIAFLEEEGSGFGQTLLGSRIVLQQLDDRDLRERIRSLDDGRPFWEHAREAGYEPERWREAARILDDLIGWVELHIEQGRVLQDHGQRIGIVTTIAGYVHADLQIFGRADHAGATPMDLRCDAAVVAAACVLELERLARQAGNGTVGTVGELELEPGLINVVPGRARLSLDVRGIDGPAYRRVVDDLVAFARATAGSRGLRVEYQERQAQPPTRLDDTVIAALEDAARGSGEPYRLMPSGAGHDTMLVAARIPSAMLFVPCRDGISHAPDEQADPSDAALGAEILLNAVCNLTA
ncbi:MAG TPA: Zn-dependent hydrolase [Bacillota bacterium]